MWLENTQVVDGWRHPTCQSLLLLNHGITHLFTQAAVIGHFFVYFNSGSKLLGRILCVATWMLGMVLFDWWIVYIIADAPLSGSCGRTSSLRYSLDSWQKNSRERYIYLASSIPTIMDSHARVASNTSRVVSKESASTTAPSDPWRWVYCMGLHSILSLLQSTPDSNVDCIKS